MPDLWEERVRAALGAVLATDEFGADGPRAVADVAPKDWREAVRACRDDLGCDFFDWLSAVDEGPGQGFRIVAHLWSVGEKRGVLLRALLAEGAVDSVVDLYPGADWHERETHEMFGVDFPGHPDLQPLLLAPEFEGHPLRKDFVLASRVVKPWPGAKEPGEGHGTARKRAPKRPPGVPEDWIEPKDDEAASGTREGASTGKPASDSAAPEPGSTDSKAPDAARTDQGASAPDPRLRRPDAS